MTGNALHSSCYRDEGNFGNNRCCSYIFYTHTARIIGVLHWGLYTSLAYPMPSGLKMATKSSTILPL